MNKLLSLAIITIATVSSVEASRVYSLNSRTTRLSPQNQYRLAVHVKKNIDDVTSFNTMKTLPAWLNQETVKRINDTVTKQYADNKEAINDAIVTLVDNAYQANLKIMQQLAPTHVDGFIEYAQNAAKKMCLVIDDNKVSMMAGTDLKTCIAGRQAKFNKMLNTVGRFSRKMTQDTTEMNNMPTPPAINMNRVKNNNGQYMQQPKAGGDGYVTGPNGHVMAL